MTGLNLDKQNQNSTEVEATIFRMHLLVVVLLCAASMQPACSKSIS